MSESRNSSVGSPQAFSVKRAQVEFHNFASLGEPERAIASYLEENRRRDGILRRHLDFVGPMTPFLEIGANAGHTSYLLCNDYGASGFALDISADALRHGVFLQEAWHLERAPVRVAGDGAQLPFRDGSIRFAMTHQTLSQFMNLDSVLKEITRVLAPGGIFFFSEEPMRRLLSLRLYRAPYEREMKGWERRLHQWGLLGYLVQDVIGAHQEESFGIRQNHAMTLNDWDALLGRHFAQHRLDLYVPERGWGERWVKRAAVRFDPYKSVWRAAKLLGGTIAAVCRKAGDPVLPSFESWDALLRCPDCHSEIRLLENGALLKCSRCAYEAANEGHVFNLLPSVEKRELYPGDREDVIDFSLPGHERHLVEGWYDLEGAFGNRYRWIGSQAIARLRRVHSAPARLRVRGFAPDTMFVVGKPRIEAVVNGVVAGQWVLDRVGLFVLEADVNSTDNDFKVELRAAPEWRAPGDARALTVNISMVRLVPRD